MPFTTATKTEVNTYIYNHLPNESWFDDFFDYIKDQPLSNRLAEEFKAIRYIYKFLEGMQADEWLKNAQIRIQIIYYASIYEAIIHHVLFDLFPTNTLVLKLFETKTYKRLSVSKELDNLTHLGKKIYTTYDDITQKDIKQIRFEHKADVANLLGLVSDDLRDELKELYALRNAIHLHAEIQKGISYEMEMSLIAYRRMHVFKQQMTDGLAKYSKL